MEDVTQNHEEKETLVIDVTLPGHDARVTTPLFVRTREQMLAKIGDRCEISGAPESECGPIEFHHLWVERCLSTAVDKRRLYRWLHLLRDKAQSAIDWFDIQLKSKTFDEIDIMDFTDDMTANGMGICKRLHTGKGEGIHFLPFPLWQFWGIGKVGFKFDGNDSVIDEQNGTG